MDPAKKLLPSPKFDAIVPKRVIKTAHPLFFTPHKKVTQPCETNKPAKPPPNRKEYTSRPLKWTPPETPPDVQEPQRIIKPLIWCYICNIGLPSEEDFSVHLQEHEECPINDCSFVGHPSIMDHHIVKVHPTNLYNRIKKYSTPESIAQWREERKKKYPSIANVELRRKVQEQKLKRGERLEANKSRFARKEDRRKINFSRPNQFQNKKHSLSKYRNRSLKRNHNMVINEKKPETESIKSPKLGEGSEFNKEKNDCKIQEENSSYSIDGSKKNFREKRKERNADVSLKPLHPECSDEMIIQPFTDDEDVSLCSIKKFRGTGDMSDYARVKVKHDRKENPLLGMLGMYGSSDSDSESDEACFEIKEMSIETQNKEDNDVIEKNNLTNDSCSDPILEKDSNEKEILQCTIAADSVKAALSKLCSQQELEVRDKSFKESIGTEIEGSKTTKSFNDRESEKNHIEQKSESERPRQKEASTFESEDDAPEEVAIERSSSYPEKPQSVAPTRKKPKSITRRIVRKSGLDYKNLRKKRPNTMLGKLLEPDIRHERNVLLQCVRYVCENNFFGIGSTSANH